MHVKENENKNDLSAASPDCREPTPTGEISEGEINSNCLQRRQQHLAVPFEAGATCTLTVLLKLFPRGN